MIATNSQLNDTINSLKIRVESLTQKLVAQCENETKLSEGYQQEIKSQTKLADLYKGKYDVCSCLLIFITYYFIINNYLF